MATGSPTPITMTDTRTGMQYAATGENWTIKNNIVRGQPLSGGTGTADAGSDPSVNACSPGPCGWVFWLSTEDNDIYQNIAKSLTADSNQWYHSSTTKSFRVPDSKGQAVDLATFRTLMSTAKSNEAHSVWSNSTSLSCTPY